MFGEPEDRGEKEHRNCNHCGESYVNVYADDETHSKYCADCAELYESFDRVAQVMNYDDDQLESVREMTDGTPYVAWVDIHPQRAYIFDARTVSWDVEDVADMREQVVA